MTVKKMNDVSQLDLRKSSIAVGDCAVIHTPVEAFKKTSGSSLKLFVTLFCRRVGLHGLNKLVDNEYGFKIRLIWIVFIIGMGAFGLYQTAEQIKKYASNPIRVSANITTFPELDVPMITLCNFNMVSRSKAEEDGIIDYIQAIMFKRGKVDFSQANFTAWNWTDFYLKYGHRREDAILSCGFKMNYTACTVNDFEDVITDLGWCYRFNGTRYTGTGRPLMVNSAGSEYALDIDLLAHVEDYMGGRFGPGSGYALVIGDESDAQVVRQSGVPISPGTHTHVALKQASVKKMRPPHGKCGEKKLKYFKKYTYSACRLECLTDYLVHHCGCKDADQPGDHRICHPGDMYFCSFERLTTFVQEKNNTCLSQCPDQCVTKYYETDISSVPLSDWYIKNVASDYNLDVASLRKDLVLISIYYKTMDVQETAQEAAYTAIDMICDIGGSFGLALGASILTALDIVDFFIYFFITRHTAVRAADEN